MAAWIHFLGCFFFKSRSVAGHSLGTPCASENLGNKMEGFVIPFVSKVIFFSCYLLFLCKIGFVVAFSKLKHSTFI